MQLVQVVVAVVVYATATHALAQPSDDSPAPVEATEAALERQFQDSLLLKMQRPINWELRDEPLVDFATRLRNELGCEVLIEEQELEDLGVDSETALVGKYQGISLQQALEHLLDRHELDWRIEGRAFVLSTREANDTRLIVRVYGVRDLVATGNFGHADFDALTDMILSTVAADTWAENGGGEADVRTFHIGETYALVISQTFRAHQQIERLLNDLRQLRGTSGTARPAVGWEEFFESKLKVFDNETSDEVTTHDPITLGSPAFEDAVTRANDFTFDLYRKAASDVKRNQMLSGFSARELFSLAFHGANGATREQLASTLRLPNVRRAAAIESLVIRSSVQSASPEARFLVANSVWIDSELSLETKFTSVAESFMDASIEPADFTDRATTAGAINRWAAEKTNNRITKVIDESDLVAPMPCLLASAVYFLGAWQTPFEIEQTKPRDFRLTDGRTVEVPTMHGGIIVKVALEETSGVKVAELPYEGSSKSMIVLLPADRPHAFEELVARLNHANLQGWLATLVDATVLVEMPKFSFERTYNLNSAMVELGATDAFDPTKANFSGMCSAGMFLQQVRQSTFILVDETGTEAAAVMVGGFGGPGRAFTELNLNRPFIFLIRDVRTGCILFVGQVVDPRS